MTDNAPLEAESEPVYAVGGIRIYSASSADGIFAEDGEVRQALAAASKAKEQSDLALQLAQASVGDTAERVEAVLADPDSAAAARVATVATQAAEAAVPAAIDPVRQTAEAASKATADLAAITPRRGDIMLSLHDYAPDPANIASVLARAVADARPKRRAVWLSGGVWESAATTYLDIPEYVVLAGDPSAGTTLRFTAPGGGVRFTDTKGTSGDHVYQAGIRDLIIDGAGVANIPVAGKNVEECLISGVRIRGYKQAAISLEKANLTKFDRLAIEGSAASATLPGIIFTGVTGQLEFDSPNFWRCQPIRLAGSGGRIVLGGAPWIEQCDDIVVVDSATSVSVRVDITGRYVTPATTGRLFRVARASSAATPTDAIVNGHVMVHDVDVTMSAATTPLVDLTAYPINGTLGVTIHNAQINAPQSRLVGTHASQAWYLLHVTVDPRTVTTSTAGQMYPSDRWVPAGMQVTGGAWLKPATYQGYGDPEGAITAPPGSTYQRSDSPYGVYTKASGFAATGWRTADAQAAADIASATSKTRAALDLLLRDRPELPLSVSAAGIKTGTPGRYWDTEMADLLAKSKATKRPVLFDAHGYVNLQQPLVLDYSTSTARNMLQPPIMGVGEQSGIQSYITEPKRAAIEIKGTNNTISATGMVSNMRVLFAPPADENMKIAQRQTFCLLAEDAKDFLTLDRLFLHGPNGVSIKVASSSSYAHINTEFNKVAILSNYGGMWWNDSNDPTVNDCKAVAVTLFDQYNYGLPDNITFNRCDLSGLVMMAGWATGFNDCMFFTNPNRPTDGAVEYGGNIYFSGGNINVRNAYCEDYHTSIKVTNGHAPVGVVNIQGTFTGAQNYAGANSRQAQRAVHAVGYTGSPNGPLGAVNIQGNALGYDPANGKKPLGHAKKPFLLEGKISSKDIRGNGPHAGYPYVDTAGLTEDVSTP